MDFKEMHCIVAIVEEGSITKASIKLGMTQPALSRMVMKIEERIGASLFDKIKTPWTLTYIGELYIKKARVAFSLAEEFTKDINEIINFKKEKLTIGVMYFEEKYILPKILENFTLKYPNIILDIVDSLPREIELLVVNNTVDFAIIVSPPKNKDLQYVPIKTYNILLVLPLEHHLAKNYNYPQKGDNFPEIDLSLLEKEKFVTLKPELIFSDIILDACYKSGFKPNIALEVHKIQTAHSLAISGYGATFILDEILKTSLMHKKAAYFKIKNLNLKQDIALAYKKGKVLSEIEKGFLDIVKKSLQSI